MKFNTNWYTLYTIHCNATSGKILNTNMRIFIKTKHSKKLPPYSNQWVSFI